MAWVLIATDDFVHLKRGFATVDGRRLSRGDRQSSSHADEYATLVIDVGWRMKGQLYFSIALPVCRGKIPEAIHCTPARARRC